LRHRYLQIATPSYLRRVTISRELLAGAHAGIHFPGGCRLFCHLVIIPRCAVI
jgi:hypothetical protein